MCTSGDWYNGVFRNMYIVSVTAKRARPAILHAISRAFSNAVWDTKHASCSASVDTKCTYTCVLYDYNLLVYWSFILELIFLLHISPGPSGLYGPYWRRELGTSTTSSKYVLFIQTIYEHHAPQYSVKLATAPSRKVPGFVPSLTEQTSVDLASSSLDL